MNKIIDIIMQPSTWRGVIWMLTAVGAIQMNAGNTPALGGTLDRVRITTVNGTDTFDAGSVNILYE